MRVTIAAARRPVEGPRPHVLTTGERTHGAHSANDANANARRQLDALSALREELARLQAERFLRGPPATGGAAGPPAAASAGGGGLGGGEGAAARPGAARGQPKVASGGGAPAAARPDWQGPLVRAGDAGARGGSGGGSGSGKAGGVCCRGNAPPPPMRAVEVAVRRAQRADAIAGAQKLRRASPAGDTNCSASRPVRAGGGDDAGRAACGSDQAAAPVNQE